MNNQKVLKYPHKHLITARQTYLLLKSAKKIKVCLSASPITHNWDHNGVFELSIIILNACERSGGDYDTKCHRGVDLSSKLILINLKSNTASL